MKLLGGIPIRTVCVASCLLFTVGCATRPPVNSGPPSTAVAGYERDFLPSRVAHQEAVVDMARTCTQKAVHSELREFCSSLIPKEREESKQLQTWLSAWYRISVRPDAQEQATQGYRTFLGSVQSAQGPAFEEALLRALRLHHHEGVRESQTCAVQASHAELRSFCKQMIAEQEAELKQVNTWICSWFRDCVEK